VALGLSIGFQSAAKSATSSSLFFIFASRTRFLRSSWLSIGLLSGGAVVSKDERNDEIPDMDAFFSGLTIRGLNSRGGGGANISIMDGFRSERGGRELALALIWPLGV